MQVLSPKPVMEERGSSKLERSRSLPSANSRDVTIIARASSLTRQSCATTNLFAATKVTRPSALLERRKRVNPALKVEAFNNNSEPPAASKPRTPYEILQVSPFASQEDIKTAYWRSARKHHPDKVPLELRESSTLLFLEIHSAYSTLKDPLARARYDLQMSLQSFQSSGYQQKSPSSYTPRAHSTTHPYTPRAPSTTSSPYRYTPRAQPTPPSTPFSPNLYTPPAQPTPSSPNLYTPCVQPTNSYTPRAQPTSPYTPRGPPSSPNYYTPRSPYSIGRSWETDQCW